LAEYLRDVSKFTGSTGSYRRRNSILLSQQTGKQVGVLRNEGLPPAGKVPGPKRLFGFWPRGSPEEAEVQHYQDSSNSIERNRRRLVVTTCEICLSCVQERFPHETDDTLLYKVARAIEGMIPKLFNGEFSHPEMSMREKAQQAIKHLDGVVGRWGDLLG
jgi:hypothetical protein